MIQVGLFSHALEDVMKKKQLETEQKSTDCGK
jgi:hypothetical protein